MSGNATGQGGPGAPDDAEAARQRVRARISQGEFLANLLRVASTESSDVQQHFVRHTSVLTRQVRTILDQRGMICRVDYQPGTYWPAQRGRIYGFIDGGVANIEIPTSAPIGIRVGSYVVRPGDTTPAREQFNIELAIMDELYGTQAGLYSAEESDDPFADTMKLRDAARIMSETAAALRLASRTEDRPDAILIHGPLVNPAAPYGLEHFPPLQEASARKLLGDEEWSGNVGERTFVRFEFELLRRLKDTGVPVAGIVERAKAGAFPFFRGLMKHVTSLPDNKLKERHAERLIERVEAFGLNDTAILDLVLREGEYIAPVPIDRQGDRAKWPKHGGLDHWIEKYPKALTTFIKPSEHAQPFRIEGFEGTAGFDGIVDLAVHTSRLLPSYVFPVGLDIVDRYSKVPAWLSAGVRSRHQVMLLRKAFESGDQRLLTYAKRVLASKGRDWLFRPDI